MFTGRRRPRKQSDGSRVRPRGPRGWSRGGRGDGHRAPRRRSDPLRERIHTRSQVPLILGEVALGEALLRSHAPGCTSTRSELIRARLPVPVVQSTVHTPSPQTTPPPHTTPTPNTIPARRRPRPGGAGIDGEPQRPCLAASATAAATSSRRDRRRGRGDGEIDYGLGSTGLRRRPRDTGSTSSHDVVDCGTLRY